jgi:hypothetical protein
MAARTRRVTGFPYALTKRQSRSPGLADPASLGSVGTAEIEARTPRAPYRQARPANPTQSHTDFLLTSLDDHRGQLVTFNAKRASTQ